MKSASATPAPGDATRTALDWPFHAGIAAEVANEIRAKAKRKAAKRRRAASGAAAALAIALALAWAIPFARQTSEAEAPVANRLSLALPDGSTVELNARALARTDFRYGRRRVEISRGEAFFSVAKDPADPFLVKTPSGTIQVTGTQFDVRLDGPKTEVTLVEGSVVFNVEAASPPLSPGARGGDASSTLRPGQQLSSTDGTMTVRNLSPSELDAATAWRDGRLVLSGRTLGDIAARLASFHGVRIAVDPDVAALEAGGVISLSNLPADLGALEEALPVRVLPNGDGFYRLVRRQP